MNINEVKIKIQVTCTWEKRNTIHQWYDVNCKIFEFQLFQNIDDVISKMS